eukprot:2535150-Rhodomonas_salina.2
MPSASRVQCTRGVEPTAPSPPLPSRRHSLPLSPLPSRPLFFLALMACMSCRNSLPSRSLFLALMPCMSCRRCGLNTSLQTLSVPANYWRDSVGTSRLYACYTASDGSSACRGSDAQDASRRAEAREDGRYCIQGHTGPLCAACTEDQFYFSRTAARCQPCNRTGRLSTVTGVVVALAAVLATAWVVEHKVERVQRAGRRARMVLSNLSLQAKFKILVSFYQCFNILGTVYGVRLHSDFESWLDFLEFTNFDAIDYLLPGTCVGSMSQRIVLTAVAPYIAVAIIVAGSLLVQFALGQARSESLAGAARDQALYASILVGYVVLPAVSRSIFRARMCASFGYDDARAESRSYLVADLHVQCSSDDAEYSSLQTYFWLFFVLWPLLVPLAFLALVAQAQRSVRAQHTTTLTTATRFLWRDYDPAFLYASRSRLPTSVLGGAGHGAEACPDVADPLCRHRIRLEQVLQP